MQSQKVFSKGIQILLAACFFGLTIAETSYAQRGGRDSSGSSSSSGRGGGNWSGGGRSSFSSPGGSGQRFSAPPSSPQNRPSFSPPSVAQPRNPQPTPNFRSNMDRPTFTPPTFNTQRTFDAGRQAPTAPINRLDPRIVSPSQTTYRAQQPSQRSIFGAPSKQQQPTFAPPEAGRNAPSASSEAVNRQTDGRNGSNQPLFAPKERQTERSPATSGTIFQRSGEQSSPDRPRSDIPYFGRRAPQDSERSFGAPSRDGNDRRDSGTRKDSEGRSDASRGPEKDGLRNDRSPGRDPRREAPRESYRVGERGDGRQADNHDSRPPKHFPPSRAMVDDVRRHFNGYDRYWTNDWYRRHPGCWNPVFIPTVRWWYTPSWYDTWTWYGSSFFNGFVFSSAATSCPYYPYYYGNNIIYRGSMVYVNGVPYVSAAEYYSQALMLAQSIETVVDDRPVAKPIRLAEGPILESPLQGDAKRQTVAKPVQAESSDWLPMGTFSLLDDITQKESGKILQLATNKKGQLRGNYADESTGETKQLFGAVDPKSQRVAFRFEGDDKTVLECGLWNLTQDSVPLLIHHGDDKTEQKTLIRLSKPEGETEPELAP